MHQEATDRTRYKGAMQIRGRGSERFLFLFFFFELGRGEVPAKGGRGSASLCSKDDTIYDGTQHADMDDLASS